MNSGREDLKPWDKWYWQDYLSETGLQLCSLAAQGLWMQMLCAMARAKNKGYLLDGDKQMESKTLAKLSRSTVEEIEPLIQELREHQVFSESPEGIIFNRRMVRAAELSIKRSSSGKKGGRPKKQIESKKKAKAFEFVKPRSASEYASEYEYASKKTKRKEEEQGNSGAVGAEPKADKPISEKVSYDASNSGFTGITVAKRALWAKAYPACDLDVELAKAAAWVQANPVKGKKSNWEKFITNWLSRAQDRGGTRGYGPAMGAIGGMGGGERVRPLSQEEAKARLDAGRRAIRGEK